MGDDGPGDRQLIDWRPEILLSGLWPSGASRTIDARILLRFRSNQPRQAMYSTIQVATSARKQLNRNEPVAFANLSDDRILLLSISSAQDREEKFWA
jgi:hypothetical protein